jgi:hypothetical protein
MPSEVRNVHSLHAKLERLGVVSPQDNENELHIWETALVAFVFTSK